MLIMLVIVSAHAVGQRRRHLHERHQEAREGHVEPWRGPSKRTITYIYIYIYIHTHMYIYIYIYTHVCVYIHIHTHIHIHVHIHVHIHPSIHLSKLLSELPLRSPPPALGARTYLGTVR